MSSTGGATNWSADNPLPVAYSLVRADDGAWTTRDDGLESRDLGLSGATRGAMDAMHVRARGTAGDLASGDDADFRLIYLLGGELTVGGETPSTLRADDAVYVPRAFVGPLSYSQTYSALEIVDRTGTADGGALPQVRADSVDAWATGVGGPRAFFAYRDLGTAESTRGHLHTHMVRAAKQTETGTGWHYHSMGQLFVVLEGGCEIGIDGHGWVTMGPLDAMCIAAGLVHNVRSFEPNYHLIELCVPAVYDTVAVAEPASIES
jgi:cupin domain